MKIKNILIATLFVLGFSSCNDFLDVDPTSKYDIEYVFSEKSEINRALNGVYAQLLSGDVYGSAYLSTFCLNSDVDMVMYTNANTTDNSYRRFDSNSMGSEANKFWVAAYRGIEYANNFIHSLENSKLFDEEDEEIMQMLGEAKVIRAMFYHDMVVMFGDVPFSFIPTYNYEDGFVLPVVDREEIHKQLIEDLAGVADKMQFAADLTNGVERVSKEFCWAMIARMAMTCGGYSLRPDISNPSNYGTMQRPADYKDYYAIARDYCDLVISSNTHDLIKSFRQVFLNECNYIVNNDDDPIFEIPFGKNSTGSIGHLHGPRADNYEGRTNHTWGRSGGGARLSAFYRYSFEEGDSRRDFLDGLWYYTYDSTPTFFADYTTYNNKWSKLWAEGGNAMGADSDGNTGINFPYMRYADVLLMYAEAVNELEDGVSGPNGSQAIEALRKVRSRAVTDAGKVATYLASATSTKETFLKAVLDERKWEFAGENMRWKDLVRNNLYSEVVFYSFLRYYAVAEDAGVGSPALMDRVEMYDGKPDYLLNRPMSMYYKLASNPGDVNVYPNTTLPVIEIYNRYSSRDSNGDRIQRPDNTWQTADLYGWWDDSGARPQCLYSFLGFIYADENSNLKLIDNGQEMIIGTDHSHVNLPVVRYILPYPNAAIQRSAGVYKNYYGYIK